MSGRSYLSIGDVLTLLRQEFQDITISKIRFLESQGLVNPERTPSGYRKFYEHDVERLRWVLRQQREHFLPLKVIKDRLDDGTAEADTEVEVEVEVEGAAPAGAAGAAMSTGRRTRHSHADADADAAGTAHVDEVRAGDPVLVGQRVGAEGEARGATVSSHPAGEGGGLPGLGSTGEGGSEPTAPTAAGAVRTPARSGSSSHRRTPERAAPLLELVNDGTAGASRAATGDPVNGTGAGPGDGTEDRAARGATASAAARSTPVASTPAESRPPASPSTPRAPKGAGATAASAPPPVPAPTVPVGAASAPSEAGGVSLSAEELATACELDVAVVRELQEYGLLVSSMLAGVEYFDGEALAVATAAASFTRFGIEPRHLRLYKNAAEREAGFVEQVVLPLVRQRNPEARARAHETADELTRLGQQLRASLLRSALGSLLDG